MDDWLAGEINGRINGRINACEDEPRFHITAQFNDGTYYRRPDRKWERSPTQRRPDRRFYEPLVIITK